MKNRTFIILLFCHAILSSCTEWLDVTPATDIDLEDQIQTAQGYKEMLNGVYIGMADNSLYGHHMTYGAVAQAGQDHLVSTELPITDFDYESTEPKAIIDGLWENMYNTIANANLILDNIEDNVALFQPGDYKLIKAEVLALRAFMHFDLLRMYGNTYVDSTSSGPQIPYVTAYEIARFPHLAQDSVYKKIITDLDAAEALLEEVDPIIGNYEGILFDAEMRKYHMNYYAVLALKARVYITKNDKPNALLYAEKVINEYQWDWVTADRLNGSDGEIDLLFIEEVVAALNVSQLDDNYSLYFGEGDAQYHAASSSVNYADILFEKSIAPSYWWQDPTEGPGGNDWRYLHLMDYADFGFRSVSKKYDQDVPIQIYDSSLGWVTLMEYRTVPLIRITELMLIAAEACIETNVDKAIEYVNTIKDKREAGLTDLSGGSEVVLDAIVKEMRKETYLEGQVFYMYKRLQYTNIPTMDTQYDRDVTPDNFIFPLPDSELEYGNIPE